MIEHISGDLLYVALRKESVDRNERIEFQLNFINVALRKESVDRNSALAPKQNPTQQSLSARRAWIEILSANTAL